MAAGLAGAKAGAVERAQRDLPTLDAQAYGVKAVLVQRVVRQQQVLLLVPGCGRQAVDVVVAVALHMARQWRQKGESSRRVSL